MTDKKLNDDKKSGENKKPDESPEIISEASADKAHEDRQGPGKKKKHDGVQEKGSQGETGKRIGTQI